MRAPGVTKEGPFVICEVGEGGVAFRVRHCYAGRIVAGAEDVTGADGGALEVRFGECGEAGSEA